MLFSQQSFDYSQDSVCTDYGNGGELEPPCLGPKKRPRAMRTDADEENDRLYNVFSQDDGSLCGSQPYSQDISDKLQNLALFRGSQDDSCQSASSNGARRGLFGDESNSGDAAAREFQISRPPLRTKRSDDNLLRGVVQKRLPAPILNPFLPADQQPSSKRRAPTVIPVPPVMPSRFKMDFDDPVRIGQGNFSIVWRARSRLDGALYAIKQLKQPFDGAKRRERMLREVCAFAALPNCPFLVKYHGCWVEENALHIVTEYCQGRNLELVMLGLGQTVPPRQQVPLFDSGSNATADSNASSEVPIFSHIQAVQAGVKPSRLASVGSEHDDPDIIDVTPPPKRVGHKIEEAAAWKMLYCVSSALAHMHEKGIAHLDVRPANMFQDGEYVKLGDLGNAAALTEKDDISEGEERYIPRELVDSEGSTLDLAKADVFSLGASLYELCLGREIASAGEEWHAIRDGDLCTTALGAYSEKLQQLARRMLDAVPSRRPTAEEIVVLAAQELLQKSVKSESVWRTDSIQSVLLRNFVEQAGFSG